MTAVITLSGDLASQSLDRRIALRASYPDEDFVLTKVLKDFELSYDKKTGLVQASETTVMSFLNLTDEFFFHVEPLFTDEFTELKWVRLDGFKKTLSPTSFEIEGIFHHDSQVEPVRVWMLKDSATSNLSYEKIHKDVKYLTKEFISDEAPIVEKRLSFHFPLDWDVELLSFHTDSFDIEIEERVQGKLKTLEVIAKDLPSFKEERTSKGLAFYAPHILILVKSMGPDAQDAGLLSSTDDLYHWYKSLVDDIGNDTQSIKERAEAITQGCDDRQCELRRLFYWVQENIRYIAFENGLAGFKPESCQSVLGKRYGDCKGMANLLAELCRSQGFDARLTWLGTSSIPYDYSIPSLAVDNHMVVTVFEEGEMLILDATEQGLAFGDIADRIQGRPAMVENGDSYLLVDVPESSYHRNEEFLRVTFSVNQATLEGNMDYTASGDKKSSMYFLYPDGDPLKEQDAKKDHFSRGDSDISVEVIDTADPSVPEGVLNWCASFQAKNRVNRYDKELYLDWDLHKSYKGYGKQDNYLSSLRGDLDLESKVLDRELYLIAPIEGYSVSKVPEDLLIQDESFSLRVDFQVESDGSISIQKELIVPRTSIPNQKIPLWNSALGRLQKEIYDRPIIYTLSQ
ncbi:MAG: transglutaminase domain-containing protein [Bacteroidetes bacterium]|nr:transglutaminase domain-containing protein [Bacteroidota bacterium]